MHLVSNWNRFIVAMMLVIAPLLLHAKPHEQHAVSDSKMHLSEIGVAEIVHSEHSVGDCCSALCGPMPKFYLPDAKPVNNTPNTPYISKLQLAAPWLLLRPPIASF